MDGRGARRLAAAVLLLAVEQAQGRRYIGKMEEREGEQQEARAFLESEALTFWCEIAEVDVGKIRRGLTGSR